VSERLIRRLVDRDGGLSRAALTASVALVAAAFMVAFLVALGSTGSELRRPAGAAAALREAASPQSASRSVELRAVAALPDLRRDQRPRHALPFATKAVSAAREPSTPEPVPSAPEPTTAPAASPPAAPAIPPPVPPAPEPREPSQPQPSFDSAGEFDSSG
jgi:hypothetical protein